MSAANLLEILLALPRGHSEGRYAGARWRATVHASPDSRRAWLWAERLGGAERVSANLYRLSDGTALVKPCEMEASVVEAFIRGYRPEIRGG